MDLLSRRHPAEAGTEFELELTEDQTARLNFARYAPLVELLQEPLGGVSAAVAAVHIRIEQAQTKRDLKAKPFAPTQQELARIDAKLKESANQAAGENAGAFKGTEEEESASGSKQRIMDALARAFGIPEFSRLARKARRNGDLEFEIPDRQREDDRMWSSESSFESDSEDELDRHGRQRRPRPDALGPLFIEEFSAYSGREEPNQSVGDDGLFARLPAKSAIPSVQTQAMQARIRLELAKRLEPQPALAPDSSSRTRNEARSRSPRSRRRSRSPTGSQRKRSRDHSRDRGRSRSWSRSPSRSRSRWERSRSRSRSRSRGRRQSPPLRSSRDRPATLARADKAKISKLDAMIASLEKTAPAKKRKLE